MSKIQVNEIVNHFDNGAPDCPRGLTIAGVATAATLDVTGNVSVGGTLTYDDVTNIDSVGIITAQAGVKVTGGTVTVGTAITLRQNGNAEYSGVVLAGIDPRGGGGTGLYIDGGSGAIVAGATGTNAILRGFQSGGSENFRFSADGSGFLLGDVGIGTDNPSDDLSILSTANSLVIGCKDSTRGNHIFQLLADDPAGNGELRLYQNSASGTHAKTVEIASSGNSYINSGSVGIGTDNPDSNSELHTIGTSYWPILVKTTSTGGGGIAIKNKDDVTSLYTGTGGGSWLTGSAITDGLIRAQNDLIFASNANNEAMRLDTSGRLLLGLSACTEIASQVIQGSSFGATDPGILFLSRGTSTPSNSQTLGSIRFSDNTQKQSALISCMRDGGTWSSTSKPGYLSFGTTADGDDTITECARIVAKGTSHFSNTGAYYGSYSGNTPNHFSVDSNLAQWTVGFRNSGSDPYGIRLKYDTDKTNSSNEFMYAGDSNLKFAINSNGGVVNFQANDTNLCDEREKKNIVSLDSKWDKVKSWELKKFHYNEDADTDDLKYGVIAQQVETLCPEVISDWKKSEGVTRKGVKEQQMMWMAIKALQEAMTKIETLEAEVAALKGS